MPQSRTRSNRSAMRAKYRKPKKRRSGSMGWNVAIAAVVVIGVVAVVLTRGGGSGSNDVAPFVATSERAQSHWHTALGVNICGEWLPDLPTFEFASGSSSVIAGIHTHSDGLVHTHPNNTSESGNNATLGKFADYAGFDVSDSSIEAWTGPEDAPDQAAWSNGDECTFGEFEGQKGRVVWAVDGEARTGNPADYKLGDGQTIAVGFVPEGSDLGFPPDACQAFANISDQQEAILSKSSPCRTTASTTTTAPPSTETTTAPATP
jgi:hypothetical protein